MSRELSFIRRFATLQAGAENVQINRSVTGQWASGGGCVPFIEGCEAFLWLILSPLDRVSEGKRSQ